MFLKLPTKDDERGFTLIEILVVIGIIAVLAAVVLIAINPARQFAQARNSERTSEVNSLLNAVGQNLADNAGIFTCDDDDLPGAGDDAVEIADGSLNIRDCIVPTYMSEIPVDPVDGLCNDDGCDIGYDTGYFLAVTAEGRIEVCAPSSLNETAIEETPEEICVTR